ncbi:MAG: DUF349 domain-containing protein [Bacteroidales bacterium]|nr:DUF349 domain-containing protein [Bacteroidales bacterium]
MEELNEMNNSAEQAEQNVNQPLADEKAAVNNHAEEPTAPTTTENVETAQPETTPVNEAPAAEEAMPEAENNESAEAKEEAFVEPEVDYSGCTREELVSRLHDLLLGEITQIKNRVASIRNAFNAANAEVRKAAFDQFIAEGGNKDEYEPKDDAVAETFRTLYNEYRERRQKHQEEVDARKQENLRKKQEIIEELRQLVSSEETIKKSYDDFNALQERWKAIGDVPRENVNDLWQTYHLYVGQFFEKVKINRELKMLDMKKNLEQKIQLCERAEELIVEPSIIKAFKDMQSLREQWREIGPVPTEHNDEIWARFCNATNQVSARHREHFEQRRSEMEKNLLAKQALVEQAAQLTAQEPTSTRQWDDTSSQLDELLKVWKTIGPVPREHNETIWNTFKSSIDNFYNRKREYFGRVKDEQTENYNKKIDLCLQAEAIAKRDDWRKATDELLQLQAEWKAIGPVAKRNSEKIWQRFRGACDEFFARKTQYYNTLRADENENLAKKEAILTQLKEYQFGEDKEENLRVIKDFQRQWMEIGFVPVDQKERLRNEFRKVLDSHFENLKISARMAEENAFRERIRNNGGDRRSTNGERNQLMDRIEKLRNDINVWENNLGFLSNSKQADLLKNEFEKKVQNARQQLALLEAKLRILNETPKEEAPKSDEAAPETGNE